MRKVCAKMVPKELTKEQKQRRVTICQDLLESKMTFWAMSSQVMKHGPTNMTLKRSGKVHNGGLPIPHYQKNSDGPNQESKQCCWLFLILEGLFIMNLYQLDKQSTRFTIWKYWKGCVKKTETTRTFCQQLMDRASRQCTCSHGTVCEVVFSY